MAYDISKKNVVMQV